MQPRTAPLTLLVALLLPLLLAGAVAAQTARPSDQRLVVPPPAGATFDAAESAYLLEDELEDELADDDQLRAVYVFYTDRAIDDVADLLVDRLELVDPLEWEDDRLVPPDQWAEQIRRYEEATGEDVDYDPAVYRRVYEAFGETPLRSVEIELTSGLSSDRDEEVWVELVSPYLSDRTLSGRDGTALIYRVRAW